MPKIGPPPRSQETSSGADTIDGAPSGQWLYQFAEKLNFLRLGKNAQMQGAPAFADLPAPAEAGASRRRERLRAGRRNPESGVATNKERHFATPTSW